MRLRGGMADDEFMKLSPADIAALRAAGNRVSGTRYADCLCGKLLDAEQWTQKWFSGVTAKNGKVLTPGINYTALLCADCRKEFVGMPRIVCLGCRSLMGFYKPGKQSTGFVFERFKHYHITDCPRCNPARASTPVLEHDRFCLLNKIPTRTNPDLIQEIEIKTLQGQRDAAKLKEELNSTDRP